MGNTLVINVTISITRNTTTLPNLLNRKFVIRLKKNLKA